MDSKELDAQFLSLSPDSKRIAYSMVGPTVPPQIAVMNADGTGQRQLTNRDEFLFNPTWSPDGLRIAAYCASDLCVMEADGSNITRLIPPGTVPNLEECRWSPDGRYMACDTLESERSIYSIDLSTNQATKLVGDAVWPSWSPDGSQIAFSRPGDLQIWMIDVDGTGLRRLTSGGRNCCPTWVAGR